MGARIFAVNEPFPVTSRWQDTYPSHPPPDLLLYP